MRLRRHQGMRRPLLRRRPDARRQYAHETRNNDHERGAGPDRQARLPLAGRYSAYYRGSDVTIYISDVRDSRGIALQPFFASHSRTTFVLASPRDSRIDSPRIVPCTQIEQEHLR